MEELTKPTDVNYTIEKFSEFILQFIDKIGLSGIDRKITLVGHSLAGYIAVEFAIKNMEH